MFGRLRTLFGGPSPVPEVHGVGRSHVGLVRRTNEDAILVADDIGLYVVCDGLGGHRGGELASGCAVQSIGAAVRGGADLEAAVQEANRAVAGLFQSTPGEGEQRPPGSTVVTLLVRDGRWQLAWVGDSRCWLFDRRTSRQLSVDHTVVQQLVSWGDISVEDARRHPDRHRLSQALGTRRAVSVGYLEGRLATGQRFLLATDGLALWDDPEALSRIIGGRSPEQAVDDLVEKSLAAGGRDNISCVVVAAQ